MAIPRYLEKVPAGLRRRLIILAYNLKPAFRGTGGWVEDISLDMRRIRVRLPFNRKTRNLVGSMYGGSLFSVTDGPHPIMLMAALGRDAIVWDKSASIRYKRPAYSTVYADFVLTDEDLQSIQDRLAQDGELDHTFTVELKDRHGKVYAEVQRTVYAATKAFYKTKNMTKGNAA